MGKFTVRRSYRQLIAERKALETTIEVKTNKLNELSKTIKDYNNYQLRRIRNELQSDKALLEIIQEDIERAEGHFKTS